MMKKLMPLLSFLIVSLALLQWNGKTYVQSVNDSGRIPSEIKNSQLVLCEALKCKDLSTNSSTIAFHATAPFRTINRTLSKARSENALAVTKTESRLPGTHLGTSLDSNSRGVYRSSNIILAICNMLL